MYYELIGQMAKHNITRRKLAILLGVTEKTVFNKISGKTEFTWEEVKKIHKIVAPEKTIEELFEQEEKAS